MILEMDYRYRLESSDFLNIVARLKTISEIELFNELNVDVFCIDSQYTTKRIADFNLDEIEEISKRVHNANKKIYAYVNPMVHENIIDALKEYLIKLGGMDIDGFIINDLTIYVIAKEVGLENRIIYQPGTMNTDSFSLEYFNERNILGITLSREITLDEIKGIASKTHNLKTSLIGHGYLDMFYSKRRLLSNYAIYKNIDGNRLIQNYDLRLNEEVRKNEFYPILQDDYGTHIFRSKKLLSIDVFDELEHYIDDFFIERIFMNDDEYYDSIRLYKNRISKTEYLNQYSEFDNGFYYQRTEKRKGELDEN